MLIVQTFGKFQITDGTRLLDEDTLRSPMLLRLLMYMMLHRDKALPSETICEDIWQGENIENPAGALKNLMYRLRKVLTSVFGQKDFILSGRGSYRWNPEEKIRFDTEEFERILQKAKQETVEVRAMAVYEQAIWLYQGNFMLQLMDMPWIVPLYSYYHSLYLTAVKVLAELYMKLEHYDLLEKLCSEALLYENGDEELYCYQIRAQMYCGKNSLALESYENAREIMEKEFGIRSTAALDQVYEELMSVSRGQSSFPIGEVQKDMMEETPTDVFLCGYPVFKEIYRYEARKSERSHQEASLVLLTFETGTDSVQEVTAFHIRRAMAALEEIIRESLRVGDVAARYSDFQFILLLPSCSGDLAMIAANRLIAKLHEKNTNARYVSICINVEKVSSSNEMLS